MAMCVRTLPCFPGDAYFTEIIFINNPTRWIERPLSTYWYAMIMNCGKATGGNSVLTVHVTATWCLPLAACHDMLLNYIIYFLLILPLFSIIVGGNTVDPLM